MGWSEGNEDTKKEGWVFETGNTEIKHRGEKSAGGWMYACLCSAGDLIKPIKKKIPIPSPSLPVT